MNQPLPFDEWRRKQELEPLFPVGPTPDHLVEVQHGNTILLKSRSTFAKPYCLQDDPRLVVVLDSRHKYRYGLLIHSFSHKGLSSVWKVKFLDRTNHSTHAILDEVEFRRVNKEAC